MVIKHIVFDSNTWISYFYNAQLDKLVELKIDKDIKIYTASRQLNELKDVLSRTKFKGKLRLPVSDYVSFCKSMPPKLKLMNVLTAWQM